jgi:hypothetical protein
MTRYHLTLVVMAVCVLGIPMARGQQPTDASIAHPCTQASDQVSLLPMRFGSKWGYIDRDWRAVVPPRFEDASRFSEGLAGVELDGKYGFIDAGGRFVVTPAYDGVSDFARGFAAVRKAGKWGLIDKRGVLVVPASYDAIGSFSDGLAAVVTKGLVGYIRPDNSIAIEPQFERGDDFSDGLAAVSSHGKWGFIDAQGRAKIAFQFSGASPFSEGLAAVCLGEKWGYCDRTGKIVIHFRFDKVGPFSGGRADVLVGATTMWQIGDTNSGTRLVGGTWVSIDRSSHIERIIRGSGSLPDESAANAASPPERDDKSPKGVTQPLKSPPSSGVVEIDTSNGTITVTGDVTVGTKSTPLTRIITSWAEDRIATEEVIARIKAYNRRGRLHGILVVTPPERRDDKSKVAPVRPGAGEKKQ